MHHLVGPHEIAQMLGLSRQRVFQLASRPDFPTPVCVLAMGTIWDTRDIERWAAGTGREIRSNSS